MADKPLKKSKQKAKHPDFLGGGEFNLPQFEEKVLAFWDERKIFEKSLEKNTPGAGDIAEKNSDDKKEFVFYEGPPYANGKPAMHHILARVVKDVMLRYKTMRGYYVPRRAGWDTHGLPVEMAAEKALGFKSKKDIEQFGVKRFNEEAKKQVWIYKDEWERLTSRIGYWLDLKNAYVTYAPEYIESIWWTLAQISKRGLLYKGHKVVPWCTRCGTALSSHELAQGYKEVVDRSAYIKFRLKPGQNIGDSFTTDDKTYILAWTTTPWTLPGNVALAVGEKIKYVSTKQNGETFILAHDLTGILKTEENPGLVIMDHSFLGEDLLGLEYEPLFEVAPLKSDKSYKIYGADFVTTTDGTGVVHTAVMYGEDDYELGKKIGLPQHHTVNEEGKFTKDVPVLTGEYAKAKDTEEHIFEHLRAHGNLLRTEEYKHEYPFCWRCGTAILYYARTSWFIAMSTLRKELLKNNETIHWMPEHVKEGRFGEWLREAKDWNLSRERYWGAPLPIWECEKCGETEVVESLERLSELAGGSKNNYWIMRHGEAENNLTHVADAGGQNFHLTPNGRKQVEDSAQHAKKILGVQKIDLIIVSPVLRTQETAEIVGKVLDVSKVVTDKRLTEMDLGPTLDGHPLEEYWNKYPTYEERFAIQPEGGESRRDVRRRMWEFLKACESQYEGKNILIVSHGDPLLMLVQVAKGFSEKKMVASHDEFYPGTAVFLPLPIMAIPRNDTGEVDLHRPFIDEIFLRCSKKECGGKMKRVPTVADVWYDSGAMPYAQTHFPFEKGDDAQKLPLAYPADYIAEGMDQTRGWFYTLLAISTALGYEAPYKNVITFGLLNDKNGQKMSKSKGNVVEPFAVIDKFGVDAVRWYFYSGTPFGEPKNFDEAEVGKALRKVHLIIYNSFVFWKTYAAKRGDVDSAERLAAALKNSKNVLDEWILVRLDELVASMTTKLDAYQIREAALEVESFVDDLSRWYIRRSRKRLQRAPKNKEEEQDYEAASATLGFVLLELVKLMAPFTPFFSEILYSALGGSQESVHLDLWPEESVAGVRGESATSGAMNHAKNAIAKLKTKELLDGMRMVREFAALGLAKRAEVGIKVRQPLAMMRVAKEVAGKVMSDDALLSILADEVNVKKVFLVPVLKEGVELDTVITPELREEGLLREVARMIQELRQKAELEPKDQIALMMQLPDGVREAIEKNEAALKSDVGAKMIEYKKSEKFEAEQETKIEGQDVWIGIRKL